MPICKLSKQFLPTNEQRYGGLPRRLVVVWLL